jgi:hypothetical protein
MVLEYFGWFSMVLEYFGWFYKKINLPNRASLFISAVKIEKHAQEKETNTRAPAGINKGEREQPPLPT